MSFSHPPALSSSEMGILVRARGPDGPNPSQEGYYNSINPLVKGVPPHIQRPSSGGLHIFTGLEYSGASKVSHTSFPVVQFIGLQYSVLGHVTLYNVHCTGDYTLYTLYCKLYCTQY